MTAFGRATVYLLVATLLACPYFCLANVTAVTGASLLRDQHTGSYDCCSRPDPLDSKHRPGQPESRQGSGMCLCHGAVMDRHVETPDLQEALVTFLPPDAGVLVRQLLTVERGFSTEQAACHFPAADSGREVRALIESLLL